MDIPTVVLLVSVLFFTYRGYKAGLVLSAGRIASLLGGYAASLLLATTLSPWLQQQFDLSELVAKLVAGVGLFVVVSAGISALVRVLYRFSPKKLQDSMLMRWSGAGLGAASGYLIAVLTLWFYSLMLGAISVAAPEMGERMQNAAGVNTPNDSVGQLLVEKTSTAIAQTFITPSEQNDPLSQATALLLTQPQSTLQTLQRLSKDRNLRALLQAPANQQVLQSGDVSQVVQLANFQQLRKNPDMQSLFGQDKLKDEELAQVLVTFSQRAENLKNDEELQSLLQDPELQQQLAQGNTLAVLTHPGGRQLMSALLSPKQSNTQSLQGENPTDSDSDTASEAVQAAKPASKIYQWVDEQGRTHFTDKEPK
ncbi:MAG: CvpA family protein [Cellvibrionaceae bacterium]